MDNNGVQKVSNEKIEAAIKEYAADRTKDNLSKVVNMLRPAGLLVPAMMKEEQKPVPFFLKNNQGEQYLAVFTSKEQANEEIKKQPVLLMPFPVCNSIVANDQFDLKGMVINPYTDNLILRKELVLKLHLADQELAKQMKEKKATMTPEQYTQLIRRQVEFQLLPKRLFTEGEDFVNLLCKEKEAVVCEIYENLGKEAKVNLYVPSDFSLMALNINPQLLLVRLDMPSKGAGVPSCQRVYLTFNPETKQAGYYTIERLQGVKELRLGEVKPDGTHVDLGEAPVEGVQLEKIMELASENN